MKKRTFKLLNKIDMVNLRDFLAPFFIGAIGAILTIIVFFSPLKCNAQDDGTMTIRIDTTENFIEIELYEGKIMAKLKTANGLMTIEFIPNNDYSDFARILVNPNVITDYRENIEEKFGNIFWLIDGAYLQYSAFLIKYRLENNRNAKSLYSYSKVLYRYIYGNIPATVCRKISNSVLVEKNNSMK